MDTALWVEKGVDLSAFEKESFTQGEDGVVHGDPTCYDLQGRGRRVGFSVEGELCMCWDACLSEAGGELADALSRMEGAESSLEKVRQGVSEGSFFSLVDSVMGLPDLVSMREWRDEVRDRGMALWGGHLGGEEVLLVWDSWVFMRLEARAVMKTWLPTSNERFVLWGSRAEIDDAEEAARRIAREAGFPRETVSRGACREREVLEVALGLVEFSARVLWDISKALEVAERV